MDKIITSTFKNNLSLKLPAVGIVREPREIRSFIVILPSPLGENGMRGVLLPGLDEAGKTAYDQLAKLSQYPPTKLIFYPI